MFPGKIKSNVSYRSVVVDVKTKGDSLPLPVNVGNSYFVEGHENPCLCVGIVATYFTTPPRYVYYIVHYIGGCSICALFCAICI
jgi:hypothetical protein